MVYTTVENESNDGELTRMFQTFPPEPARCAFWFHLSLPGGVFPLTHRALYKRQHPGASEHLQLEHKRLGAVAVVVVVVTAFMCRYLTTGDATLV